MNPSAGTGDFLESAFKKDLGSAYGLRLQRHLPLGTIRHAYSHFSVTVHAYSCTTGTASPRRGLRWIRVRDLPDYPMGRVDRQIADMLKR
jgi:A/G-specific adenine glycosylase